MGLPDSEQAHCTLTSSSIAFPVRFFSRQYQRMASRTRHLCQSETEARLINLSSERPLTNSIHGFGVAAGQLAPLLELRFQPWSTQISHGAKLKKSQRLFRHSTAQIQSRVSQHGSRFLTGPRAFRSGTDFVSHWRTPPEKQSPLLITQVYSYS